MIQIKDVTKLYPAKESGNESANGGGKERESGAIHALDHISLHVAPGEWLSIMGPSGSGKSTLVNLIGCLDRPSSGEIWLDGQNVARIPSAELDRVRAEKIGFIFQQFHLIPFLTAVENVMLAQYFHSMTDEKEAVEALTRVGLGDRTHHLPSQLSGGEQQRVCIARALINDPRIILADEPTGNLDAQNEEIVLRLLREFHQQGRTIVMVTHDPVVARLADRRIELHHGKIASQEVFSMADEEQLDEVLEELWVLAEHGEIAEVERMEVHGALPVNLAIEKMIDMGFVVSTPHQAASARPALSAAIAWPSACLPIALPWTANQKSSNKPASSNTSCRPRPPTRYAPSSAIPAPARTVRPSRPGPAAEGVWMSPGWPVGKLFGRSKLQMVVSIPGVAS